MDGRTDTHTHNAKTITPTAEAGCKYGCVLFHLLPSYLLERLLTQTTRFILNGIIEMCNIFLIPSYALMDAKISRVFKNASDMDYPRFGP